LIDRQFERLGRAVDEAELEVPISDAYELADAAKSHERLAEGRVLGKIVLMVRNATTLF
jgi:NADPH:quinone reductase-like Zn-dependent oxidoreductase